MLKDKRLQAVEILGCEVKEGEKTFEAKLKKCAKAGKKDLSLARLTH
jgi:hypothetical protein